MKTDDEDDGGLINNLSGREVRAPAQAVFPDGRRTTIMMMKMQNQ